MGTFLSDDDVAAQGAADQQHRVPSSGPAGGITHLVTAPAPTNGTTAIVPQVVTVAADAVPLRPLNKFDFAVAAAKLFDQREKTLPSEIRASLDGAPLLRATLAPGVSKTRVAVLRLHGVGYERRRSFARDIIEELAQWGLVAHAFGDAADSIVLYFFWNEPQDLLGLSTRIALALSHTVHPNPRYENLRRGWRGLMHAEVEVLPWPCSADTTQLAPLPFTGGLRALDPNTLHPQRDAGSIALTLSEPLEIIDRERAALHGEDPFELIRFMTAAELPDESDELPVGVTAAEWGALTPQERTNWTR